MHDINEEGENKIMLTVIMGGSGSGKSSFAENYICQKQKERKEGKLLYVATMQPFGEEVLKKIKRHKKQRANKGFLSIEQYQDIGQVESVDGQTFILLECLSNLLANEMYIEGKKQKSVWKKIVDGLQSLEEKCAHLVLVTNEVFSEGKVSWEDGEHYLNEFGKLNVELAQKADQVYQIKAGIPIIKKDQGKNMVEIDNRQNKLKKQEQAINKRVLIIGGAYQGKTKWAINQYKIESSQIIDCRNKEFQETETRMIIHFEQWIEDYVTEEKIVNNVNLLEECWNKGKEMWMKQKDWIVIVDEIGLGMVPMGKKQRIYRELVGRMTCRLAQEAEQVYQITAGIPLRIK